MNICHLITAGILCAIGVSECLECFDCVNIADPRACTNRIQCANSESCYLQTLHSGNEFRYTMGCQKNQLCSLVAVGPNGIIGRSIQTRQQYSCHECCSSNLCNKQLCAHRQPTSCIDDITQDCAHQNTIFNVCADEAHAKTMCPQSCGLCQLVDGSWADWGAWSTCSVTCNTGSQTRTRTCTNPSPANSGLNCTGPDIESKMCANQLCPELTEKDCLELRTHTHVSGVYRVRPEGMIQDIEVYCYMATDGGGWTVFQSRVNGSVDFYQDFYSYENGFGNVHGEHWLGLKYTYAMTSTAQTELRIDLMAADGSTAYEVFPNFRLSAAPNFTLHVDLGHGTAGDIEGLSYTSGYRFVTYDRDDTSRQCASLDHGGWWYKDCAFANLNGQYVTPGTVSANNAGETGVTYRDFKGLNSLKVTTMMFRRV